MISNMIPRPGKTIEELRANPPQPHMWLFPDGQSSHTTCVTCGILRAVKDIDPLDTWDCAGPVRQPVVEVDDRRRGART